MKVQVKAWGNSQGIRISKDILREADVEIDDELEVKVVNGMITLVKPFRQKTVEERAAEYNGNLNFVCEYNWGEPVGREVW